MNNFIKKYWPLVVAVIVIIVFFILKPSPNNELRRMMEAYRKEQVSIYNTAQRRIESLRKDSIEIRLRMKKDIEFFQKEIAWKNIEFQRLKKKIDAINFKSSDANELDSIRDVLYNK